MTSVHHWSDRVFSFRTTRDQGLRFRNGHFLMLGLCVEGKPLIRAYFATRTMRIEVARLETSRPMPAPRKVI